MYHYSLIYDQFKLQVTLYTLKIAIYPYPYTRYDGIMGLVRPLLIDHANELLSIDEICMVKTVALPSIHPQFAVITMFEENTLNKLLASLTEGMLYHVRLELERLDPDATLVCIPNDLIIAEPLNANKVAQALRDNISQGFHQMTLTGILHSHHVDTSTVLDALAAWFCDIELRGV